MVPSWNYIVPSWNHMVPSKPANLHFLLLKYLRIGFSKNRFHIQHHKNMLIVSSTLKSSKIPTFVFKVEPYSFKSHLSPRVSFIYDLVYDSGILQRELFNQQESESRFGQIAEFGFQERVKQGKNGQKWPKNG